MSRPRLPAAPLAVALAASALGCAGDSEVASELGVTMGFSDADGDS